MTKNKNKNFISIGIYLKNSSPKYSIKREIFFNFFKKKAYDYNEQTC